MRFVQGIMKARATETLSCHLSAVSATEHCGPNQCMYLSPGQESYHTVTYQIIAWGVICFNHLTDQAFIWDRCLIPSSQKIRDENVTNFASL